ncbi:MAG: hypothetical protein ACXAC2_11145, partial [Candidatus Kariarchaeaceae archaeon]
QQSVQYSQKEKSFFNSDRQRNVSRYYKFVQKNDLMKSYQLRYNRKILNIYNQIILTGKMSKENKNLIKKGYENNAHNLPFNTRISFNKENFIWLLYLPHEQITQFMRLGYDLSSKFNMMIVDDNLDYSRIYPLWHRNFVEEDGLNRWRSDKKWMIDEPINNIL